MSSSRDRMGCVLPAFSLMSAIVTPVVPFLTLSSLSLLDSTAYTRYESIKGPELLLSDLLLY